MNILKICLDIIGIVFCFYTYIKACMVVFNSKIKNINFITGFVLLLVIISTYYNVFNNYSFFKIVISFLCLFLVLKVLFKENMKSTFLKLLIVYLIGWIIETLLGTAFIYIFLNSLKEFDSMLVKLPFSILTMLLLLLVCYIKPTRRFLVKIYNYMVKTISLTLLIFSFLAVLVILTFYIVKSYNLLSYISIITLIIIFAFIFALSISQVMNIKNADEKQEILLNFMKKYETIIDNEKISRHEMLNNLLILKSIKDKNSKKYDKILEEIMACYKTDTTYNRLYDLPSGLKGLFYYKIYDMQNKGIEPFIDISNNVIEKLEELNVKDLSKLSKILGILLDNSKEGAEESDEKIVIIEVYEDNGKIIIYIENSISKDLYNIDIKSIKEKGFSTKGSKRGYGLYLAESTLKRTKKIFLEQKIENKRFISIVRVK